MKSLMNVSSCAKI